MSNGRQNNHSTYPHEFAGSLGFENETVAVGAIGLQLQLGQNIWMCVTPQIYDGFQCIMTDFRS